MRDYIAQVRAEGVGLDCRNCGGRLEHRRHTAPGLEVEVTRCPDCGSGEAFGRYWGQRLQMIHDGLTGRQTIEHGSRHSARRVAVTA